MKTALILLSGLVALSAPLRAQVLYEEHFAGGTADLGWVSHWGEESNMVVVDFVVGNPSGDGFVGKLGNDLSGGGVGSVYMPADALEDYTVSAQVLLVPGEAHYRGVIGRSTGVSGETPFTFYSFVAQLADPGTGGNRFRLRSNGLGPFPTTIRDWPAAELGALYPTTESWVKMSLRMEGNQIWCYLNDTLLPGCPFTDSNITAGGPGVYFWSFDSFDQFLRFDDLIVEGTGTAVAAGPGLPSGIELLPNTPNPFNPSTWTRFRLDHAGSVRLAVYNLQGALVRELSHEHFPAGEHRVLWDGRGERNQALASGTYLLSLESGGERNTRSVLLLK
ncbi:MAG: hypothetical protein H6678_09045 [Candidatus Delongbacteria bacterium]|nr:hypothetical protein [Candidatus Cloacimonadota bacterium]MCB9473943.1 hypothetical protein [Candidatus Delongbacteria bacterium]